MKKILKTVAVASVAAFTLFAAPASAEGERYVFISHAPDSDSWWNTIKTSLGIAEEQLGVTVEYRNPPTGDIADMARIVEQAAASGPDGIILSIADFDALSGPVRNAVDQGIPVITVNSGNAEQSAAMGALMHIGQPEYDAGHAAGTKAAAAGVESFLCVNHYITNGASVERCQGFADAIGADLGTQMIDSGQDPGTTGPPGSTATAAVGRADGQQGRCTGIPSQQGDRRANSQKARPKTDEESARSRAQEFRRRDRRAPEPARR